MNGYLPKGRGRDKLEVQDYQIQIYIFVDTFVADIQYIYTIYKVDEQEGTTVQHISYQRAIFKIIFVYESLCCTPETNTL